MTDPQKLPLENVRTVKYLTYGLIALTYSGDVYVWGSICVGHIFGSEINKSIPYKLPMTLIKKIKPYDFGCMYVLATHNKIFIIGSEIIAHEFPHIEKINCGVSHIIALTKNKKLYSRGFNSQGQLGLGDRANRDSFEEIHLTNIVRIKCGQHHNVALASCGKIYVWGRNEMGQLGLADKLDRVSPTELKLYDGLIRSDIVSVSCGISHTSILLNTGQVYIWGGNQFGQVGLGYNNSTTSPQKLNLEKISRVMCHQNSTFLISTLGKLYVCGYNNTGILGLGHNENMFELCLSALSDVVRISHSGLSTLFMTKYGQIYGCGETEVIRQNYRNLCVLPTEIKFTT